MDLLFVQWFHSGNISEGTQNTNLLELNHLYVHLSIIYNHQDMEAAQVSIRRWVGKTTMGHLHNVIQFSHKKEENFTICNSIDESWQKYAKWSKPEKDKY